jgi:pilus assembly protein CpaE
MTGARIVAVGTPPTFRQQVARALDRDVGDVEWMPTVSAAEAAVAEVDRPTNVLVLSAAIKEPDAFGLAEFVGRTSPATAVLLVRDRPMNGLLPNAMRAGIRDVVDLSQGGDDLREALARAISWSENIGGFRNQTSPEEGGKKGAVISVFSSKGGTGKTFLACNLAAAIASEFKADTAVIDLEFGVGDVFAYFGLESTRPLQDLLAIGDQTDADAVRDVGSPLTKHLWGYATPGDPAGQNVSGEAIGKVIRSLTRVFDFVVIDGTAQYSDPVLAAFDLSDAICLIAGLDVVGIRHLSIAMETLLSLGFPRERFRVVLNRADSKVGLSADDVQRILKVKADGLIPSSRLVPTSLNRGGPVVIEDPRAEVSKAVFTLARTFAAPVEVTGGRRRLFGKR